MAKSLAQYLVSQPLLTVLRGLLLSPTPRHLRDLAAAYSLSPAGVSDILRRLKSLGVLKETRRGNRRCFSLTLTQADRECLDKLFTTYEHSLIAERAKRFSRHAVEKLTWVDESLVFYKEVKGIIE